MPTYHAKSSSSANGYEGCWLKASGRKVSGNANPASIGMWIACKVNGEVRRQQQEASERAA